MEYTGNCLKLLSFWAINGELKLSVLKGQLEEMKAMGLRGTVFHPRYYPGRPAYMSGAYLDILSEMANSTRLWSNNGRTPNEIFELYERPRLNKLPSKTVKVGRNDLCPCGSGKKYKKCCGR